MKFAAVQMRSGTDLHVNLIRAESQIAAAAEAGAQFVALPENFALMPANETDKFRFAEADGVHGDATPIQTLLSGAARRYGIWLLGGTYPAKAAGPRVRQCCKLYAPDGTETARYDKLHLFDVNTPDGRESYRESAGMEPGEQVVTAAVGDHVLGFSICYDLRFPELFRVLSARGATVMVVPAAFTATTGRAHWHTLLRARAIENLCYVIAPGQGGHHENGRDTFGHSLIIDPWGEILAEAGEAEDVIVADAPLAPLFAIRERFPALSHRRLQVDAHLLPPPGLSNPGVSA